jgi:outer membrane lipoprotein-sorting protein
MVGTMTLTSKISRTLLVASLLVTTPAAYADETAAEKLTPPPESLLVNSDIAQEWVDPNTIPDNSTPGITLDEIETYLQSLGNFQAQFMQIAPHGSVSSGTFSLKRPGRLRFEYEPPNPLLVVSDGKVISLVDYDLKQVTKWPIKKTPLRPLVRSGEIFGEDVTISHFIERGQQIIVRIAEDAAEEDGAMELVFNKNPLRLVRWEVIDPRGRRTIVVLNNLQTDVVLEDALWDFKDPRPRRSRLPGKR